MTLIDKLLYPLPGTPEDDTWSAPCLAMDNLVRAAAHYGLRAAELERKRQACIDAANAIARDGGYGPLVISIEQRVRDWERRTDEDMHKPSRHVLRLERPA
jgi:hypothetical protein